MGATNAFLPSFAKHHSAKFANSPRRYDNLHSPVNTEPDQLRDVFCFPDGQFEVRWKSVSISYSVFDKDQRVTHAAIIENNVFVTKDCRYGH